MIFFDRHISDFASLIRFIQKNPFVRFAIAFIAGILLQYFCNISILAWIVVCYLAFAFILLRLLVGRRFSVAADLPFAIAVSLFFLSMGGVVTHRQMARLSYEWPSSESLYELHLHSKIKETDKTIHYEAFLLSRCEDSLVTPVGRKVVLYIAKDSSSLALSTGDCILASIRPELPYKSTLSDFDYPRYLLANGYAAVSYVPSDRWRLLGHIPLSGFRHYALGLRSRLLSLFSAHGVTGSDFAVLSSVVLGYQNELSAETRSLYSRAGAAHVLAVSGLHVGIIYGIIFFLLGFYARHKWGRYLFALLLLLSLWIYAFITGLSPSVVRASLMLSLCVIGDVFVRQRSVFNSIALSALIILLSSPLTIFDVGFQLSYVAVISIVMFTPLFMRFFDPSRFWTYRIVQVFAVSLAANILVMPLSAYYFNTVPIYFLLSNLIVTLLAPLIICSALLFFLTSAIPFVGTLSTYLMSVSVRLFDSSISLISRIPGASLFVEVEWWQLLLFLLMAFVLFWMLSGQIRAVKVIFSLSFFILCMLSLFISRISFTPDESLVVSDNRGDLVVNVMAGGKNVVYTSDSLAARYAMSDVWLHNHAPQPLFVTADDIISNSFSFNGKSYLVMTSNFFRGKVVSGGPLSVDCLIVGSGTYPSLSLFDSCVRPSLLVLSPSVWEGYIPQFIHLAHSYGISVYDVRTSGPYVAR